MTRAGWWAAAAVSLAATTAWAQPPSDVARARCELDATGASIDFTALQTAIAAGTPAARDADVQRSRRADVGGAVWAVEGNLEQLVEVLTVAPLRDECEPRGARAASAAELATIRATQRAWRRWKQHRRARDFGGAKRLAAMAASYAALVDRCVAAADQP